jgi:hypothetical protein
MTTAEAKPELISDYLRGPEEPLFPLALGCSRVFPQPVRAGLPRIGLSETGLSEPTSATDKSFLFSGNVPMYCTADAR